ncbi:MAG TPA: hypothetical protein VF594_03755 [Rubricoccaceae bacterium]|jgi:hypothetical protein
MPYSARFYPAAETAAEPFEATLARRARLVQLTPIGAVRAWLRGDVGRGDEAALCAAIRRDPEVDLTDDEIVAVFYEVLSDADFRPDKAEAVLTLLREAVQFRLPTPRR